MFWKVPQSGTHLTLYGIGKVFERVLQIFLMSKKQKSERKSQGSVKNHQTELAWLSSGVNLVTKCGTKGYTSHGNLDTPIFYLTQEPFLKQINSLSYVSLRRKP